MLDSNRKLFEVCPKCSKKINKGLLVTEIKENVFAIVPREILNSDGSITVSQRIFDPNDFPYRKPMRTRYAKSRVRPEYYGTLKITADGVQHVK